MAENQGNVTSVKRSRAIGRSKEQVAGWVNDEKEKGKVTTGEWEKMKKKRNL